ncbi:hypothetical protein RGUI_3656 [Rhodovulum sp. P5]|uniref:virulence factor n=1 Tax=Rhodovulum sp. P5 TaxID=1564506 RepID=UPI0009C20837|nr:virulence factor [Rhodovulum sp. P5]ARE41797.1 hypothetical protein RGUI_3656 [Rhodovulum sp. P5]
MADLTIVFWRDIPAQIIVGRGRRAEKRVLPERFEQAIDRCAMAMGAKDSDAYLAEWRRSPPQTVEGDPAAMADAEAQRIAADYDDARLKALIAASGWERDTGALGDDDGNSAVREAD